MSLKTLYYVWTEDDGSFEDCEGQTYHQIESGLNEECVAKRWVEERHDPHNDYPSLNGDGIIVFVRDPSGKETTVRVHGSRSIAYSSSIEDITTTEREG